MPIGSERPTLRAVGNVEAPADAKDLDALWIDAGLGDALVDVNVHTVAIGKPKDFFRTAPTSHRRRVHVYTHKVEGVIDTQHYLVRKEMRGRIERARPCTLIVVVDRNGTPRLWPIPSPGEGETDNQAWQTARAAAKAAVDKWTRLVWLQGAYRTRDALDGYAPDPDFAKLPPFNVLVDLAFGQHGIISDTAHPIYRELMGAPKEAVAGLDVSDDEAGDL